MQTECYIKSKKTIAYPFKEKVKPIIMCLIISFFGK